MTTTTPTTQLSPQCQATLVNGNRCAHRAKAVLVGGRWDPVFVCGVHSQKGRIPSHFVRDTVDVATLPEDLLEKYLWAWQTRVGQRKAQYDEAWRALCHARTTARAVEAEAKRRTAPPASVNAAADSLEPIA